MKDNYRQHRLNLTFKGKTYHRIEDLAKAVGLPVSKVNHRWQNGIRSIDRLTFKGDLSTSNSGYITIEYNGIVYPSLAEFARKYKLNYEKLGRFYRTGITNPKDLIELSHTNDLISTISRISKDDFELVENYLNSIGLLSNDQVFKLTGVDQKSLAELIKRITRGQSNNSGLLKSDIKAVTFPKEIVDKINNLHTLPLYAFKPSAVEHMVKVEKEKSSMIKIPFDGRSYFFQPEDSSVWGYRDKSKALKKLIPYPKDTYTFRDKESKRRTFSIKDIKDIIENPEIKGDDLITKKELCEMMKITISAFDNRYLARVLPPRHNRYASSGRKVSGWLPSEIEEAKKLYPNKFKPLRSQRR